MFNEKVAQLLNDQINKEFYSAYLYLDFASYYEEEGLAGYANWFKIQAQEERDHAMLFMQYMHNNGLKVTLEAIGKPDVKIENFMDPLVESLAHEKFVTASINDIYAAAEESKDYRTMKFLDWFIEEQGEEETNAETNIKNYELFGSTPQGLYSLNAEMASRVYTAPSLVLD